MQKINDKCMLCSSTEFDFVNKLRDDDSRSVFRCVECDHVQILPLPTQTEDDQFYGTNGMLRLLISKDEMSDDELMRKYQPWGIRQADNMVRILNPSKEDKILEIGAGYGYFIETMHNRGFCVDGIELSTEKQKLIKRRNGIQVRTVNIMSDEEEIADLYGKYDIVCYHHVLEHVRDPKLFITQSAKLLRQGGILYIEVPNHNDWLHGVSMEYRAFDYFRAHLSYFTPKILTQLLEEFGFQDIQIKGHQLYSVENAIRWLRVGKPFKFYSQLNLPNELEWLNDCYRNRRECGVDPTSDCFIAYASNGGGGGQLLLL